MKKILVMAFIMLCAWGAVSTPRTALADESSEYLKFTCIPEIGYMELTSTISYNSKLSSEEAERLGLLTFGSNPVCDFPDKNMVIELQLDQGFTQKSPCAGAGWHDVTIMMNGKAIKTLKFFGKQCSVIETRKNDTVVTYAPDIIAYQSFGGNFFYTCSGRGYKRVCESFQISPREIERVKK